MSKNEFLIVGAGPAGVTALTQLLRLGVVPEDITMADPNIEFYTADEVKSIEPSITRYRAYDALLNTKKAKQNKQMKNISIQPNLSSSFIWGASCLPNRKMISEFGDEYLKHYGLIAKDWSIQAEYDQSQKYYNLTEETMQKLPRKYLAHEIIKNFVPSNSTILGHSRIAISEQCRLCDRCFAGCPSQIPWTPKKLFNKFFLKNPRINLLNCKVKFI